MFKEIIYKENKFKINEDGSIIYKNGKQVNINTNADGYRVVSMSSRTVGVHRLVALAYVHNSHPDTKIEVNHIDFNRVNNHYSNLEWMTHAENIRYSVENGRYKGKFGKDNPNYGNTKLSEFYSKNPEIAIEKQSRPASQNGRATPIKVYKDGVLYKSFKYIGECAEYLHLQYGFSSDAEVVRCGIRRSISKNRPYKGFTFKK